MKRSLVVTISLSLAALAVCAAAPIAVATPGTGPMPTAVITAVTEEQGFTVDVTPPTTASAALTLTVHGTVGARVQAYAGRNLQAKPETYTIGMTAPDGSLVISLTAPAGGWRSATTYQWGADGMELGADAYARGTFTTPAWTPTQTEPPATEPPGSEVEATGRVPATRNAPLELTVFRVRPDEEIEASVMNVATGELVSHTTTPGDSEGEPTPVILQGPDGGWSAETQYRWEIRVAMRGSDWDVFTTPAWTAPVPSPLKTAIQLPKTKRDPVVITVTGADPEATLTVSLSHRGPDDQGTFVDVLADVNGRAVATLRPDKDGWRSGAQYYWTAWQAPEDPTDGVAGTLTMPTWNRDGGVDKPGETRQPSKPGKPKERTGGVSKTGVGDPTR